MRIDDIGDSASSTMILTLVIPFVLMILKFISMERVWSLYNMLQVQANNYHLKHMYYTATIQHALNTIKNVSFLAITKNPVVARYL